MIAAMRRAGLVLMLALLLAPTGPSGGPRAALAGLVSFERGALAIETAAGARHDFEVEIATSRAQQAQGLMYRKALGEKAGMLFVYRPAQPVAMWMKNTLIPLDMLFIDAAGRIAKIAARTVPLSLTTIESEGPVQGVLELNAGTAARLGITPGDRVLHPAFGTSP